MATVTFPELHNNGITTLNGAITDAATSVILATGGAAALGLDNSTTDAYLTIIDATTWRKNPLTSPETLEIVQATAVSTDTLTVTRGVDGTSGIAFADGSIVELRQPAIVTQRITDALTDGTDNLNVGGITTAGDLDVGGDFILSTAANEMILSDTITTGSGYKMSVECTGNTDNTGLVIFRDGGIQNNLQMSVWFEGAMIEHDGGSTGDNLWVNNNNTAGDLILQTQGSTALTLDSNQDATFTGDVDITGGDLTIQSTTPASASATGTAGTITYDSSYIYICTATDTWKRVAISTW